MELNENQKSISVVVAIAAFFIAIVVLNIVDLPHSHLLMLAICGPIAIWLAVMGFDYLRGRERR